MRRCTKKTDDRGIPVVKLRHSIEQMSDEFCPAADCVGCNLGSSSTGVAYEKNGWAATNELTYGR